MLEVNAALYPGLVIKLVRLCEISESWIVQLWECGLYDLASIENERRVSKMENS